MFTDSHLNVHKFVLVIISKTVDIITVKLIQAQFQRVETSLQNGQLHPEVGL